ncbi:hypothetical protein M9H77_35717 [Catharanthus roseus]|uniref:Uncharacterized protein n=1 Tax=Catharanthus roseus TaxID=4058 RepID=A0ACB9ZU16_CATRO|nr:hypothetical protein M9H77_35717 [Catharanthus roseus]
MDTKPKHSDIDQESQEAKDLLHSLFTSARPKKIKDNDGSLANGMIFCEVLDLMPTVGLALSVVSRLLAELNFVRITSYRIR